MRLLPVSETKAKPPQRCACEPASSTTSGAPVGGFTVPMLLTSLNSSTGRLRLPNSISAPNMTNHPRTPSHRRGSTMHPHRAKASASLHSTRELTSSKTLLQAQLSEVAELIDSPRGFARGSQPSQPAQQLFSVGTALMPALSRFQGEAVEMRSLALGLETAAQTRSWCARAIDDLSADFERSFPAPSNQRGQASVLVIKSSNIASRLQEALRSLEESAANCLNISHEGASERESMIGVLQAAVAERDVEELQVQAALLRAQEQHQRQYQLLERGTDVVAALLGRELTRSEETVSRLQEEVRLLHVRLGDDVDAERARNVAHLGQMAVHRLLSLSLSRGWTSWADWYRSRRARFNQAFSRFRNAALFQARSILYLSVNLPTYLNLS